MKSMYLRASAALACALALSGCGGSDNTYYFGGVVYGVTKTGLVLTNNGGSDYEVPVPSTGTGSGSFWFPGGIGQDDKYNVEVKAIPSNVEKCEVFNGSGRAVYDVSNVTVSCTFKTHTLGGTITGLTGELVLVNGSDRKVIPAGTTTFAMDKVAEDVQYGITVLQQPAGQTCTVANGVGTMGTADVNNVAVTCAP